MNEPKRKSIIDRAIDDQAHDRTTADQLLESADAKALHGLVIRLIDERLALARGIEAIGTAMSVLREGLPGSRDSQEATASLERVATEALGLAREVVRAFSTTVKKP